MEKFRIARDVQQHKISRKPINITTVVKKNKKRITPEDIKQIGKKLLQNNNGKKLMIKVLSDKGYLTLKNYDESIDIIDSDIDYINGREEITNYRFFKVSFYII